MCVGTLGHIPRYMGRASNNNNNKVIINNSLCYFATRVVYARSAVTWDKGIYMRVSLFGLFLRCTNLMKPKSSLYS